MTATLHFYSTNKRAHLLSARRSHGVQRRPEERRHGARLDHEGVERNRNPGSQRRRPPLHPREDGLRGRRILRQK